MPDGPFTFEDFMTDVAPALDEPIRGLHGWLSGAGYTVKVAAAKSGYVVTYTHPVSKRALFNYIFRKPGLTVRLYADHVGDYEDAVEALPEPMFRSVRRAAACRRLLDPAACNARCPMGYDFTAHGERHRKCRYNGFIFTVTDDALPHIRSLLEREVSVR